MSSTYMEKLKDPRWQKKRLKILERDEWRCRICGDEGRTLHVHHTYYEPNTDPWDHPPLSLITLCEDCHEEEKLRRKNAEKYLISSLAIKGFLSTDIDKFILALYEKNVDHIVLLFKERFGVKD